MLTGETGYEKWVVPGLTCRTRKYHSKVFILTLMLSQFTEESTPERGIDEYSLRCVVQMSARQKKN